MIKAATVDVTQSKFAEAEANELSGRLIGAQEVERSRIARELHDGLSQNLALLSIRLETLGMKPDDRTHVLQQVDELSKHLHKLSLDVHRISYELHPTKLEQLGLEAALRGFCREISSLHDLNVSFSAKEIPLQVSNDTALCLYRVVQESLWNAVKHSGASEAAVRLVLDGTSLFLHVEDNGCGYDPQEPRTKGSLGLLSMRERVRSANGTLRIESLPGEGTRIDVQVPCMAAGALAEFA